MVHTASTRAEAGVHPRMRRWAATIALLFILGACAQSNPAAEEAAANATGPWLALMDAGDYTQCWEAAAAHFREQESLAEWRDKAHGYRDPLGAFQSRTLSTTRYFVDPWGAPPGEYVVVVHDSRWDAGAIFETVNMQRQGDGGWLVVGYNVQQHTP